MSYALHYPLSPFLDFPVRTPILNAMAMSPLSEICKGLPERRVKPGEALLVEYQKARVLFILKEGTVEILKDGVVIATVSESGSVFGEVSVLLDSVHKATVRAVTEVVVHVAEKPVDLLKKRPKICFHVASVLAQRLEKINSALVDLKQRTKGPEEDLPPVQEILDSILHSAAEGPG